MGLQNSKWSLKVHSVFEWTIEQSLEKVFMSNSKVDSRIWMNFLVLIFLFLNIVDCHCFKLADEIRMLMFYEWRWLALVEWWRLAAIKVGRLTFGKRGRLALGKWGWLAFDKWGRLAPSKGRRLAFNNWGGFTVHQNRGLALLSLFSRGLVIGLWVGKTSQIFLKWLFSRIFLKWPISQKSGGISSHRLPCWGWNMTVQVRP